MTVHNLRKKIIKRLLIVAFLMSVVSTSIIYYIEIEEIDDLVVGLAESASRDITDRHMDNIALGLSQESGVYTEVLNEHLRIGDFKVIELYGVDKNILVEAVHPDFEHVEDFVNKESHVKRIRKTINYRKFTVEEETFFQVFLPLTDASGKNIGYFEGIYLVDAAMLKDIYSLLFSTLLQITIAIFVTALALYPIIMSINARIIRASIELMDANVGMLEVLGEAISKRDSDTNSHNYRVAIYSVRLGELLGIGKVAMRGLIMGAFLHDIGKIGISDNILLKSDKLTSEEFDTMKIHVSHGVDILKNYRWFDEARNVVMYHHEKFDGSGYLTGLNGEEIPLGARIFSIVDVFDALTSERPYKKPFDYEETIAILQRDRGRAFDPHILDKFLLISEELYDNFSKADYSLLTEKLNKLIKSVY